MRMRKKPLRGEPYIINGKEFSFLEDLGNGAVKLTAKDGKIEVREKSALKLPVIDTQDYEKLI